MVIGDYQKYLSVFLTLKVEVDDDGAPTNQLAEIVINILTEMGFQFKTVEEVVES